MECGSICGTQQRAWDTKDTQEMTAEDLLEEGVSRDVEKDEAGCGPFLFGS